MAAIPRAARHFGLESKDGSQSVDIVSENQPLSEARTGAIMINDNVIQLSTRRSPVTSTQSKLTQKQRAAAREIVNRYDPTSMNLEEHRSMRRDLSRAGIGPGKDLQKILHKGGFRPHGPYARSQNRVRHEPEDTTTGRGDALRRRRSPRRQLPEFVLAFRAKMTERRTTPGDFRDLANRLRNRGFSLKGNLVDEYA
jgi:hypothetical protein